MTEFLNPQQLVNQLELQPNMQVADFGCGSGNNTIILAKAVGKAGMVFAFDVLKSALESVKSRADLEHLSNIKLFRVNLEIPKSSGLEENSVDLVLLANILFQSPNQKAIIQEAERVVKKNKCIVIVDWKKTKTPYQTSPEQIKQMVSLNFEKEISVGDYHFGLVFRKA